MTDDELGSGRRQKPRQRGPAREVEGEALDGSRVGGEPTPANIEPGCPTWKELMEEVVAPDNIARAMKRVLANKGSPGIDGMTVNELPDHWRRSERLLREQLLAGSYKATPVSAARAPSSRRARVMSPSERDVERSLSA